MTAASTSSVPLKRSPYSGCHHLRAKYRRKAPVAGGHEVEVNTRIPRKLGPATLTCGVFKIMVPVGEPLLTADYVYLELSMEYFMCRFDAVG